MHSSIGKKIIETDVSEIIHCDLPWEKLYGKTVLISGANGYVPAYFIHTFLSLNDKMDAGIRVLALCRNEGKTRERFANYLGRNDFFLLIQDVCQPIKAGEPVHYFIHAASPAGVKTSNIDPIATLTTNIIGTQNMIELATKNVCEGFLLLSSIDVYGKLPTNNRFSENLQGSLETLNVRNAYAIGKRTAEALCAAYYSQYGVPVKIVRPGQIIGPGIALDDGRLCIDFISQILSNGKIVLKSDGTAKRTFIYMTDAITGMLTALLLGKCGEAYNVCDENGELTVFELAELMCSLSENKGARVEFDWSRRDSAEVTHAQSVVTGASAKIRKLSWTPKTTVSSGIKRMMDYYGL